jgi:hypothetical protein
MRAFLRLITSARVFGRHAVTVTEGWGVATAYLTQPAVRVVTPGIGHAAIAAELAKTHDHGFRRFSHLRVIDPLIGSST